MKNDPYLKKQTNKRMRKKKKKKKERKKERKLTRTFKSRPKGYGLECCTKCLLSSRRSNLATTAQNWQANLPGFLRCNCIFFTHETLRCS